MRILGNIVRLFTKRLSFKEVLIWLAVIVGLASLLFYWALCNVIRQGSAAEHLLGAAFEIRRDFHEHGECDLREVRKRFSSEYQVPLLWTKVVIISEDKKYDGSVICCVPRSYFGKLAMGTVGVLLRRDRHGAGYTTMTSGIEGSPHFIREKGAAP
jgi:hypothetical protein